MSNYPFEAHEDVSNNRSGIYAIINLATNKLYIGSAKQLQRRKLHHLSELRNNIHHSKKLQNSYNKWGDVFFIFKVVEYCDIDELIEREQYWINQFDLKNQLYNINPSAASCIGVRRSIETKRKLSEMKSGIKMSLECRENMRKAQLGRKHSEETKNKIARYNNKKVFQLDKNTYDIVNVFDSVKEIGEVLNINIGCISAVCRGEKPTAGGYIWRYGND